uniref:Uncharacterized protein n=1 Tax=Pararge aegeria TaxID=116150 RepID=S4NQA0_9NEOP
MQCCLAAEKSNTRSEGRGCRCNYRPIRLNTYVCCSPPCVLCEVLLFLSDSFRLTTRWVYCLNPQLLGTINKKKKGFIH